MGPLQSIIQSLLEDLTHGVKEKHSTLQSEWPSIVGSAFSQHTRPALERGGTLRVWVDDSSLASELSQRYSGTILKRAENILGEGIIKKIKFRVGS